MILHKTCRDQRDLPTTDFSRHRREIEKRRGVSRGGREGVEERGGRQKWRRAVKIGRKGRKVCWQAGEEI